MRRLTEKPGPTKGNSAEGWCAWSWEWRGLESVHGYPAQKQQQWLDALAPTKCRGGATSHLFKSHNLSFRHRLPVLFGDVSESFQGLGGASWQHVEARTLGKPLCDTDRLGVTASFGNFISIANLPTWLTIRKVPAGMAESPRSNLQPRVGIINSANRTSNMEPNAQNSWGAQKHDAGGVSNFCRSINQRLPNGNSVTLPPSGWGSIPLRSWAGILSTPSTCNHVCYRSYMATQIHPWRWEPTPEGFPRSRCLRGTVGTRTSCTWEQRRSGGQNTECCRWKWSSPVLNGEVPVKTIKRTQKSQDKTYMRLTFLLPYLSQKIPQMGAPIAIARNTTYGQNEKILTFSNFHKHSSGVGFLTEDMRATW